MLVFGASEEGAVYNINKKKFYLTKSSFARIINEKIRIYL